MAREMKDSGIEWVGKIPINWSIRKGKYILNLLNRCIEENSGVVTCFRDGQVTLRENRRTEGFTNAVKEIGYQGVKPGDLVVHGMDGFAGAIGISDSIGKMSPIINVLDSNQNKKYLMYYLRSMAFENVFLATATGIRERSCDLRWNKLANLEYPIPPLSEQQKIADFLDEKVKEIDNAIEKTKETIELYKSFANSMLTEFVTGKNLKSPKVKYDNMNYLGEVPKSWGKTKLKTIFRFVSVKNHPNSEVLSLYRDYGVIPKSSRDDNHNVTSLNLDSYKFVKKGNLVINKMKAWQGSLAISNYEGIVSPAYHVFEFKTNDVNKMYIHYLIRSKQYAKEFERLSTGMRIGQWDLSKEDFLNTSIIIPDIKTQQEIVEKIEKNMNNIFVLINKKNKLIDDLENYKKSLIYEYVTGKKEVK